MAEEETITDMKHWMKGIATVVAVIFASGAYAQEQRCGVVFSGEVDIVSNYMWRGLREAGASIQPSLAMQAGNFSVAAWGTTDFAAASYKEMDLTVAYELGPVSLSLADIYCVTPAGQKRYGYFDFTKGSPHRIEAGVKWRVSEQVPVTLAWYTTVWGGSDYNAAGRRAYASYAEVSYPFAVKGIELRAGIGVVPWNSVGVYGIDRDFYVQDIFISAGRSWTFEGLAGLEFGIFTSVSWNPALEDVNFTGGLSFRM
ncbi:MAG TPA: hypothetical protein H9866_04855 [Candidatus Tidjanibacter gallistercoris]|nr:hypothetical protein [Candidatus Tidjanibacter gallistercoris]